MKKLILGILGSLAMLLSSSQSYALPLLSEAVGQTTTKGLTLYPDSQDKDLYYYMPNSSMMAHERTSGLPMFGFTYWGLTPGTPAEDAGAYMVFSLRLTSDHDQVEALKSAIASGHKVAVLPIKASTINLNTNAKSGNPLSPFFSEFNFALHGGMAEDEVGVNSILTGLGARVFKAAVDNPMLLKIDYCYKVEGLGPDFDAQIHLDWVHTYTDIQAHLSAGSLFSHQDISAEVERLCQDGAITITINGGTAKDAEYITALSERIADKLFTPSLSNTPVSGGGDTAWSFVNMQLKVTDRKELKSEDYRMIRRQLTDREFCMPLQLSEIRENKDKLVHNADL